MGEKLVIGPVNKGLRTDREPFVIDNDSFPVLVNAYQWRGRVKRKRGTQLITRLQRAFNSGATTIAFDGSGNANLLTGFSLESTGNIVPGSVTITGAGGPYTDPTKDGYLTPFGTGGLNTITYSTGAVHIPALANLTATASFNYYPCLPVMGIEEVVLQADIFPGTLAFDTTYSYNVLTTLPYNSYDVNFYKNPADATYPGYLKKGTQTPFKWNGQNYQQFWTTNYENALWATNGITVPFTTTNIGMQFKPIVTVTVTAGGPPAIATLQITGHGLDKGDFLFINEVLTTTGINFQTGYVINKIDANNVSVEFPNAVIAANGTGGIAQYLTNNSDPTKDCIKWYDGDPTQGGGVNGWVNFMPPLSSSNFSIGDLPAAQYYLVGAQVIVPFKDRILFFGPVVQTSKNGAVPIYLQDTVVYSQNGTPYYTASFDGTNNSVLLPTTAFTPILTPNDQTAPQSAAPNTFFADVTGFGGNITAGFAQPILSVIPNEDVLLVGFSNRQTRFIYTGLDLVPFNFFVVNSEFGTASTFSAITLDRGGLSVGNRGIIMTSQIAAQRIDLEIPDQVFEFTLSNNGFQRVTAQRDFINEWVYFTYPSNQFSSPSFNIFNSQTLQYNYRDNSWGIFNETYTTYGPFRKTSGNAWTTYTDFTWENWNETWLAGSSTLSSPVVLGGNTQGFILERDVNTQEDPSITITSFSGSTVTSPNHCLNTGDYIIITGCLGTIGSIVNGNIYQVLVLTSSTFMLNPTIGSGTYFGGGVITRMYVPMIQTKQFPVSWGLARKTRLGQQQYLLTGTPNGQVELQIYLSQDAGTAYNAGPIVPANNVQNNSLIYTDTLFTCPEVPIFSITNQSLGLLGDGVLTTLSITLAENLVAGSVVINIGNIASFTDNGLGGFTVTGTGVALGSSVNYTTGAVILVFSAAPSSVLSFATYNYTSQNLVMPTASQQQQIWHRINTSLLGDTVQVGITLNDAQMRDPNFGSQFEEIELHSIVIDVQPSQVLA
jgi:hypothetical protein